MDHIIPNTNSYIQYHLFTMDAVSMYNNIFPDEGIDIIELIFKDKYLNLPSNYPVDDVLDVIMLVLINSVFQFGNLYFVQEKGIDIGTPLECGYATMFFAYHEIKTLIVKYAIQMMMLHHFINNGIGIWAVDLHNPKKSKKCFREFMNDTNS